MASTPYCEQVGVYLHEAPVNGEIKYWYIFIRTTNIDPTISFNMLLMVFILQFRRKAGLKALASFFQQNHIQQFLYL